jgi:hypothetical protein
VSISIPPGYSVSRASSRSISFRRGTSALFLSVVTERRSSELNAAPDRTEHEKACPVMLGGYPADIKGTQYGHNFNVWAEWDGRNFWPAGDWRRWLVARMSSTRLRDATVLRQALYTLVADWDLVR